MAKNNTDLTNLRFNITEDMNNMFIELVLSKQMLENDNLTLKEQIALKKHIDKLTKTFVSEFRKNNVEERKKYNELMNK